MFPYADAAIHGAGRFQIRFFEWKLLAMRQRSEHEVRLYCRTTQVP